MLTVFSSAIFELALESHKLTVAAAMLKNRGINTQFSFPFQEAATQEVEKILHSILGSVSFSSGVHGLWHKPVLEKGAVSQLL